MKPGLTSAPFLRPFPVHRYREMKRRTLAELRLHPNFSAVALDDFLAHRQADARPCVLFARVQALKNHKNPFGVLRVDPDPVVF